MGALLRRPHFALAGIAAAAAAVILVMSFGLLASIRLPSGPDIPVVGPATPAVSSSASIAPPDTPIPPETSYAEGVTAADAKALADLVGTWSGTITEVGHTGDSSQTYAWGVRPETTWTTTLTFGECSVGTACGSLDLSTADYAGTGQPQTCSLVLTLRTHVGEPMWPAFTETAADEATTCDVGWLDAGVLPEDASEYAGSLRVEDYIYGHPLRQGTLARSPAAPTAAATPASAAAEASAALAAIAGAWTGMLVEPRSSGGPAASYAVDASSGVTFDATVTIDGTCALNARCGSLLAHTALWPPTGQPLACRFDLTFRGLYQGSAALSFDEVPATSQSTDCAPARMVVTPLTSGQAIAVEEMAGGSTFDHGVLTRSSEP